MALGTKEDGHFAEGEGKEEELIIFKGLYSPNLFVRSSQVWTIIQSKTIFLSTQVRVYYKIEKENALEKQPKWFFVVFSYTFLIILIDQEQEYQIVLFIYTVLTRSVDASTILGFAFLGAATI